MTDYKLFYKCEGTVWKHFFFDSGSDSDALNFARKWAKDNNVVRFGVEKITKTRLL